MSRVDYNAGALDRLENLMSNRIDRVPRNQRDRRRTARAQTQQKVKKRKLVFLQSSPDYCRMNATAGYKVNIFSKIKREQNLILICPGSYWADM